MGLWVVGSWLVNYKGIFEEYIVYLVIICMEEYWLCKKRLKKLGDLVEVLWGDGKGVFREYIVSIV